MTTLEKKVQKTAEKTAAKEEDFVKEVKLLLTSNASEERQVLDGLGLTTAMKVVEDRNGKILDKKNLSTRLGKTVISIKDAQELCLKYRLYMRPANKYKGNIPPDLGAELRRFCHEKNIAVPANSEHSNFYIIAPPKMFVDYKDSKWMVKGFFKEYNESVRVSVDSVMQTFQGDPILVYHEGENLAVIKSWGEDFTPVRRFMGIITQKTNLMIMNFLFNALFVLGALWAIITPWVKWDEAMENNPGPALAAIGINILVIVASVLWLVTASDARKWLIKQITQRNDSSVRNFWKTRSHYNNHVEP